MPIEIRITDPHLLDQTVLRKAAVFLLEISGNQCTVQEDIQPAPARHLDAVPPPPPLTPGYDAMSLHEYSHPPVSNVLTEIELPPQDHGARLRDRGELDSQDLPWDARIHSRTKTKGKTGEWKLKREVDPRAVAAVKAELKNSTEAPFTASIPLAPTVPLPPSPHVPPAPAAVENPFPRVMKKITSLSNTKKINPAQVITIVESVGLPSLTVVPSRPDLIPLIEYIVDRVTEGYGIEESISFMKTAFHV